MSSNHPTPRDVARPFTPALSALIEDPLFSQVWERPGLSKRDRSLITVAALVVLYRPEQLPAHLRMAIANGLTKSELSEAITHTRFLRRLSGRGFRFRHRTRNAGQPG